MVEGNGFKGMDKGGENEMIFTFCFVTFMYTARNEVVFTTYPVRSAASEENVANAR